MALQGSVDFVIRATDLTSKPTQDIVSALQRLDQAQKNTSLSADEITQSTSHLKDQQQSLLQIISELDKRLADVSKYEKNADAIESLSKVLGEAKTRYADLTQEFFKAQEGGNKLAVTTAAENLKATSKLITETQRQLDTLNRQQTSLQNKVGQRGGVDLTRGSSARDITESARGQAQTQLELNQQLRSYLEEQAAEEAANRKTEARKRAELEETARFEQQLESARDRNRRNEYEQMYLRLLEEQDAELAKVAKQEKDAAEAAALRAKHEQQAAEALDKFRQIGERAKVALEASGQSKTNPSAVVPSTSASSSVRSAIDPLKEQVSSLSGVETALSKVEAKIKQVASSSESSAKKIESLNAAEKELDVISKSLGAQAGFIDKLNTQNAAVALAKDRLDKAELSVREWSTAIQNAATVDDRLVASLQQAQGRLQGAKTSFDNQNTTLARLRAEAQAAGINVDKLAQEEDRLVAAAQRAATSQRQVGDALDQSAKGGQSFANFLDVFQSKGRTTLSFTQRLRGEIISLTAAYVGVQGVIRGFGATLDAVNTTQQVKAQIAQTTDSPQEAASQFQFLVDQANRTAFSIETVAKAYTTIIRQAKEFGLSQGTINKLFADALTVGRSYNQNEEQLQATMVALGQIFDKTTIQAQEFKQQLSNQGLAGLFPALAKVMEQQGVKSIADLRKAMEAGTISAANLVPLFGELADQGDVAFVKGMASWNAQVGRFRTQLFTLENQFADSGFLEGVSEGLQRVSDRLKDPETQAAVKELGQNIGKLISFFAELATDADVLHGVLSALEVFLVGKFILSITTTSLGLVTLAAKMEAAGGSAAVLSRAIGAAGSGGLLTAAIALGVALGALIDKIPGVEAELDRLSNGKFWDTLEERMNRLGAVGGLVTLLEKAVTFAPEQAGIGVGQLVMRDEDQRNFEILKRGEEARARLKAIHAEMNQIRAEGNKASEDDLASLKALEQERRKILTDAGVRLDANGNFAAPAKTSASKTGPKQADSSDAQANAEAERISLTQSVSKTEDDVAKIRKIAKEKELRSQKDFLAAYTEQYKNEIEQAERDVANAKKVNDVQKNKESAATLATAETALANLRNAIKERADVDYEKAQQQRDAQYLSRKEAVEKKAASLHEQAKELELAQTKRVDTLIAKVEDDNLQARIKAVDDEIAQINQKYEEQIRKNNDAIAASKKLGVDTSQLEQDNALIRALQSRLPEEQKIAEKLAEQKFYLDESDKAEQKIQEKLKLRSALINAIQAQQKAGSITPESATDQIKAVDTQTLDGPNGVNSMIDAQVSNLTSLINAQVAAGNASTDFTQKLELQRAELVALKAATAESRATMTKFQADLQQLISTDASNTVASMAQEIGKAAKGMESFGQASRNAADIFLNGIADMLIAIAQLIIKQTILNALKKQESNSGSGGGIWGTIVSAAASYFGGGSSGSKAHTGAIVGAGGVGGATPFNVNPLWFIGAPRYHTGGFPGLAPDEYPIIAQEGEEILSKDNPRNALNGGGQEVSQVGAPGGDINLHMHADAGSFFSAGLNTKTGQRDFFVFIEANRNRLSKLLK